MTITVHSGGITIHFPSGTDQTTIDQVMRYATGMDAAQPEQPQVSTGNAIFRGVTNPYGISDEIGGAIQGVVDVAGGALGIGAGDGSFTGGYNRFTDKARALDRAAQEQHPYASLGGQVGGMLITAPWAAPEALAAGLALKAGRVGLGMLVKASAKVGAKVGAVTGAANAEGGIGNRVVGGLEGAGTGLLTGGALPIFGRLVKVTAKPAIDFVSARINPAGFTVRKIGERITAGGRTIEEVAHRMERAANNGDLLSLADVGGKQLQRLGRTVVNMPGKGSSILTATANREAMYQGGRLGAKVETGFGVPGWDYQEAKAATMNARSNRAKPFYDLAYKTPIPLTGTLKEILQTPSGKAGLAAAKENAANLREPWAQSFPAIEPDGTILKWTRVPNAQALDEVKRVLDGMVEAAKKPADGSPFGKALETAKSRAIQSVRDDLRNYLTTHNEPYRKALAVGLDNIQADQALEFGRNVLNTDHRIIARRMGLGGAGRDTVFNDGQKELVRIAAADAIKQKLGENDFTRNGLLKFFSSPNDLKRLRPLFRSHEEWQGFRQSMFNEVRKRAKSDVLKANSTTVAQAADMADAGYLGEVAQTAIHATHSIPAAIANLLIRNLRRLGGLTPAVNEQIARIISTRNVDQVRGILRRLHNIELSRAGRAQKLNAARNLLTAELAMQEGRAVAPQPNEPAVGIPAP